MAKLAPAELQRRLARGLKEGGHTHTVADIQQAVEEGRMQSWVNEDSLVLTEVLTYPQCKKLNVVMVVGDLDDLIAMQDEVGAFARAQGCTSVFATTRPGMATVLPKLGWKQSKRIIFERDL